MLKSGIAPSCRSEKKYKKYGVMFKQNWQLYVFLILPVLYILVFAYIPMFGIQLAFKKYSPALGILKSAWVGLGQFQKFISYYRFWPIMRNTFMLSVYSIAAGFPIPVLLALFINSMRRERFKKVSQTILYIPHFISVVVLVGMMNQLLHPIVGIYGNLGRLLTGTTPKDIFSNPYSFAHLFVWSDVWQHMGWNSIIYLAALSTVSPELHEAAQIDGASRFKRVLYVDFPSIVPSMAILLILRAGSIMSVGFEKVFLMQNPINLEYSEIISTYTYKMGFETSTTDYAYATAIGLFNSVINFVILVIVNKIAGKLSEYTLW